MGRVGEGEEGGQEGHTLGHREGRGQTGRTHS